MMSNPGKVAEGEKLMKAAEKLCAPSVLSLRFKPEWEQACPLFERAAVAFKAGKAWLPAISALERAAQAQERQGSPWHAGKALESCAACAKEAGDAQRIVDFSHRAAEMFIEAGRPLQGADSLRKVGLPCGMFGNCSTEWVGQNVHTPVWHHPPSPLLLSSHLSALLPWCRCQ